MNPLKWHKELAEKVVAKVGLYNALWAAFIKGVIVTYIVFRYVL
ncbi:hypothetical protein N9866_00770 [Flavobacteriaceae bacterium]|jgi:H+/gluconate symporter-like permease|nr:hypothetical protein [Flavobacteriaceae bacterium]MDA9225920.1 hypothetical protein [Flavobacteriaceae bacterium]MDA9305261.1 hypothetical protein [Flavobacteriaceae bacterium]MDA9326696.1 hypothetical protein [Flavobacteriaceae bacterium]MDA9810835.1 hypothetical protein [Flavobacteriaceae bacterium]